MGILLLPLLVQGVGAELVVSPLYEKEVRIVQSIGTPFRRHSCLPMGKYNPVYSIFYHDIHVVTIRADVGPWKTSYRVEWNQTFCAYTRQLGRQEEASLFLQWFAVLHDSCFVHLSTEVLIHTLSFVS